MQPSRITPGGLARKVLGRHFKPVGDVYRRIFVDLNKVADSLSALIPPGAEILDIGGGDGALVDRLLDRRSDLFVTMCDLAPKIGTFLSAANQPRVQLLPATDFTVIDGTFDFVTVSDVIHHVPLEDRDSFFGLLADHCRKWQCRNLIVKDIEPGSARASLAKWTDWYISGEKQVIPFSRADFADIAKRHFPEGRHVSMMPDMPNYCELLSW